MNGSTTPSKEYIYTRSQLLATIAATSTVYHHPDHLSNRAETDTSGALVRNFGHFPYGEVWYESSSDQVKFTAYQRDAGTGESGLDYAVFRSYNSGLARFLSADLLAGNVGTPQSMNRNAYTTNDPVNFVDPLGLENDCGGPCVDFTVPGTNGCVVVTYYQITSKIDGKKYDMPQIWSLCIPKGGDPFAPGAFDGQFGGGIFRLRQILRSSLTQCVMQANRDYLTQMNAAGVKDVTDPDVRDFTFERQFGFASGMTTTTTVLGAVKGFASGGGAAAAIDGGIDGFILAAGGRSGYALAKTESVPKFFKDSASSSADYDKDLAACHAKFGD